MKTTAKLLTAIAVAAVAFSAAAADEAKKPADEAKKPAAEAGPYKTGDERPTAAKSNMTPEQKAADKSAKRAPGKDVPVYDLPKAPPKGAPMTPEQKAADKAAKRTGVTPEEQAKQTKSGGS